MNDGFFLFYNNNYMDMICSNKSMYYSLVKKTRRNICNGKYTAEVAFNLNEAVAVLIDI